MKWSTFQLESNNWNNNQYSYQLQHNWLCLSVLYVVESSVEWKLSNIQNKEREGKIQNGGK